jgi:endonuclease YncB( thermonuclease family)
MTDGDTFEVKFVDGERKTIQLIGVDAPETVAANETPSEYDIPNSSRGHDWLLRWGENAKMFVKNNTTAKQVLVVTDPILETRDDPGHLLAYVYYDSNQNTSTTLNTSLGHTLLERGLARQVDTETYTYTLKDEYQRLVQDAQTANRGLWAFEMATMTISPEMTPTPEQTVGSRTH